MGVLGEIRQSWRRRRLGDNVPRRRDPGGTLMWGHAVEAV